MTFQNEIFRAFYFIFHQHVNFVAWNLVLMFNDAYAGHFKFFKEFKTVNCWVNAMNYFSYLNSFKDIVESSNFLKYVIRYFVLSNEKTFKLPF